MSKNEQRPEQAVREKLENARAKMYLRFGEKGTKRLLWGSLIVAVAVVLLIVLLFSLKINEIDVTGDVTMFNESDVISAAELSIGDSWLLRTSGRGSEERSLSTLSLTPWSIIAALVSFIMLLMMSFVFLTKTSQKASTAHTVPSF